MVGVGAPVVASLMAEARTGRPRSKTIRAPRPIATQVDGRPGVVWERDGRTDLAFIRGDDVVVQIHADGLTADEVLAVALGLVPTETLVVPIPFVPNKRFGGVCLGGKIAPIFYNTMEDSGALPIELDVSKMEMGDEVELRPYEGKALKNGEVDMIEQVPPDYITPLRGDPNIKVGSGGDVVGNRDDHVHRRNVSSRNVRPEGARSEIDPAVHIGRQWAGSAPVLRSCMCSRSGRARMCT